jgi:HEAT repeat protein
MIVYCFDCWATNDENAERCVRCGGSLIRDEDYDSALIAALGHPEATTPVRVAWILGERRTASAVGPLRRVLRQTGDPYLLEAACVALGLIGDATAEPELVDVLRTGPFLARRAAATALGKLNTASATRALDRAIQEDPSASVRDAARMALQVNSSSSLASSGSAARSPRHGRACHVEGSRVVNDS